MYKRIVMAYDGSESGQQTLLEGFDIAQWSHGDLFLVAVVPDLVAASFGIEGGLFHGLGEAQMGQEYRAILAQGIQQISARGMTATGEVLTGDSVEKITQFARRRDADLIVVGHKHREGWAARWWSGSTSPALIEHAHCSVLVVITQ